MQFNIIATIALFAAAVSAVPVDTEDAHHEARALGVQVASRSILSSVCNGACDVACNSTVLALAQTKCLEICKAKC